MPVRCSFTFLAFLMGMALYVLQVLNYISTFYKDCILEYTKTKATMNRVIDDRSLVNINRLKAVWNSLF